MHANGFDLQLAREHEAELLKLAAPAKVLPPRPARRGKPILALRLRRRRAQAALDLAH